MKKVLAIALASILTVTAAYTALAVDEEPVAAPVVVEESEIQGNIDDVLAALEGDEHAQAIADDFVDAVKKGAANEDVNALLLELASYINSKGYDVNDLKNKQKAKEFVGDFLEDCGVDSDTLGQAIAGADEVFDSVFGGETADNGTDGSTGGSDGYYYDGGYVDYGVDSTTIPDTGYLG